MLWMFKSLSAKLSGNKWDIPVSNFGEVVRGSIYRSAYPSVDALKAGRDRFGIKTVLDLRTLTPIEIYERRTEVENLGMDYVHIPMNEYNDIPPTDVRRAVELISWPKNLPVWVHCAGGVHRTGLVILAFRMWRMGYSWEEAFEEAEDYHFYSGNKHEGVLRSMKRAGGRSYK